MRKSAKALLLVVVALFGSLALAIGAAFSAAFAFGAATALIVPGTGTHNVLTNKPYRDNAVDRFITPTEFPCTSTDVNCNIQGVDYPATFWPLVIFDGWCPGLSCDTWNESVGTGVTNLDFAVKNALENTDGPVSVFGYSQGGAVVSREMVAIINDPTISDEDKARISVVTIGNINNPLGLWSRLSFLPTIPILDISFGPQLPTSGIKSTNYSFEYDPVGDAPQYWGNPVTMLNALAAFEYVHGYYLVPNDNGTTDVLPYGYTYEPDGGTLQDAIDAAPHRIHDQATFVLIPQQGALPLYQPILDLGEATGTTALVKPLVALVNPATKLVVDLGYDREWDPGVPRTLSLLPFNPATFNPVTFGVQFVGAVAEGVQDALNGGASLDVPGSQTSQTTQTPQQNNALQSFSRLVSEPGPAPVVNKDGAKDAPVALVVDNTSAEGADTTDKAKDAESPAASKPVKKAGKPLAKLKDAAENAVKKVTDGLQKAADKLRDAAADNAKKGSGNDKPAESEDDGSAAPANEPEKAAA